MLSNRASNNQVHFVWRTPRQTTRQSKPNFYRQRMWMLVVLHLLGTVTSGWLPLASGLPASIDIGAVFTDSRPDLEIAFRLAIARINADRVLLPATRLVPRIERINASNQNSFHAEKKVCSLLSRGVVALFDPIESSISSHIQSICDSLDIPHIEARWDFGSTRHDLAINLYPRPSVFARSYVDLVKFFGWQTFSIVYEEVHGLFRLQEFFKEAQAMNWHVRLHQFEAGRPYRETFWKVKQAGEVNIIVDVANENIFRALKHAQQVGMVTEEHSFLVTQPDLHTINLEDFRFSKTKITAFKLIDSSSSEHKLLHADWRREFAQQYTGYISTEAALIYDAIKLLATGIQDLDHSQALSEMSVPVSCQSLVPWAHGSSLMNYMRPLAFRGLTGLVRFNELGHRSSITLNIVTVTPDGLEEVGTWSEDSAPGQSPTDFRSRLNISRDWTTHYSPSALENKTLIITTILNDPYTMIKDSSFKRTGNDQFEGYAIDLIAELAKILHFKYEFRLVKDGAYGRPGKSHQWNGMMGELMRGEADLAVADLTITSKREEVVDFTHPFMNTGISILFKKPTKKVTSLFSFLSPFSNIVWIYVLCAYVGISTTLFLVGRLSPYEWENPHPCRAHEQVLENAFSLSNTFWFTIGSLMQQASDLTPKAMSTRTISAIWYFFTLIMIASYTANLAAFLTVEKIVYPIENAEGLSAQDKIKYGCLASGSTASFFQESNITTYKRMWDYMSARAEVFMRSNEEGRKNVEKGDGLYAYLMESASIEYTVERNCNLTQIGGLLDSKGYGVATRKDSPYRMPLSQAILQLQESGVLLILKERWWKQKKGGGQCIDDSKKGGGSGSVTPLKIDNVGGVFVVLLGGLSLSLLVAILEFIWKARMGQLTQDTVCEEMIADLRFAFLCQSSTKIKPSNDAKKQMKGTYFEESLDGSMNSVESQATQNARIYSQQPLTNGHLKQSMNSVRFSQRASFPNGHCDSCALNIDDGLLQDGRITIRTSKKQNGHVQPHLQHTHQNGASTNNVNARRIKNRSGQSNSCSNLLLSSTSSAPVMIATEDRAANTFTLRRVISNGDRLPNGTSTLSQPMHAHHSQHHQQKQQQQQTTIHHPQQTSGHSRLNGNRHGHHRSIEDDLGHRQRTGGTVKR